ncbi:acyltransferase family protein [Tunturibacter empetritectus]|uniref:Fucose 4-O-acetylase-like acetyltransferase n=1 Tax=Tunturiibacter lichenicola TaxID=2051959 RepID=A0A7W8N3H4_9BACT|nr:acyltransferase [Edaphobacter lichenicola]MBB5343473.1 fucose 4-O-acetylase-like acetyltransferase [Edaphobacter lichenicola]
MIEQALAGETREPITSGRRSNLVDRVKGIAIILVVYGHTAQGVVHRGWWSGSWADFSKAFIYSFHMPAFFFASGLFVCGSIRRRGSANFALEKVKTILYPYLLFAVIFAALGPLIRRFQVSYSPFHWNTFLMNVADGSVSWFLFTLFWCLLLALLTVRLPNWLRFLLSVLVGVAPLYGTFLTDRVLQEFCFVAAGMWVGHHIFRLEHTPKWMAAVGFVLLAAFQFAAIYLYGFVNRGTYIVLGLTGTAGLFLLSRLLESHRIGEALVWVGRASLAIFLLSAFAQGATRVVLSSLFHTNNLWLQLLLPTAFATVLPAIVWYQQDRWRLGWLFHWPF